jgi:predicted dehydrogenase
MSVQEGRHNMAQKLRWGILSTAMINDVVIAGIRKAARSELVAVSSRDADRARAYAAERNIPKAYGSYNEMLSDPDINAVYVSVPNTLHREWAVKAADAGKHVLCEKPLVTTLSDFRKVDDAVRKNRIVLFEAYMYLHHPQTRKVIELIKDGALGKLLYISAWFDYYLPDEEKDNIRVKKDMAGGSLWDVGVYPNSMAVTVAAAGAPVQAHAVTRYEGTEVDSSSYGTLTFSDGVEAHLCASIKSPFREGVHIVGSDGFILVEKPWKPGLDGKKTRIQLLHKDDTLETFTFRGVSPYQFEVEAMEACVLDDAEPIVSLELSKQFLQSMLALHESARIGKAVKP